MSFPKLISKNVKNSKKRKMNVIDGNLNILIKTFSQRFNRNFRVSILVVSILYYYSVSCSINVNFL